MGEERLFVPLTDAWWEPTEDPKYYRTVEICDDTCHHPVHAFNPERRQHLEEADWIRANAESAEDRKERIYRQRTVEAITEGLRT